MGEVTQPRHSYIVTLLHCYIVTLLHGMVRLNTEQGQEGLHTLGAQYSSAQDVWRRGRGLVPLRWGCDQRQCDNDITAAAWVCYNI